MTATRHNEGRHGRGTFALVAATIVGMLAASLTGVLNGNGNEATVVDQLTALPLAVLLYALGCRWWSGAARIASGLFAGAAAVVLVAVAHGSFVGSAGYVACVVAVAAFVPAAADARARLVTAVLVVAAAVVAVVGSTPAVIAGLVASAAVGAVGVIRAAAVKTLATHREPPPSDAPRVDADVPRADESHATNLGSGDDSVAEAPDLTVSSFSWESCADAAPDDASDVAAEPSSSIAQIDLWQRLGLEPESSDEQRAIEESPISKPTDRKQSEPLWSTRKQLMRQKRAEQESKRNRSVGNPRPAKNPLRDKPSASRPSEDRRRRSSDVSIGTGELADLLRAHRSEQSADQDSGSHDG